MTQTVGCDHMLPFLSASTTLQNNANPAHTNTNSLREGRSGPLAARKAYASRDWDVAAWEELPALPPGRRVKMTTHGRRKVIFEKIVPQPPRKEEPSAENAGARKHKFWPSRAGRPARGPKSVHEQRLGYKCRCRHAYPQAALEELPILPLRVTCQDEHPRQES